MLDFSAGWGDRLIGALAAGVDRYFGADPNLDLKAGHDAILHRFSPDQSSQSTFQVVYEPFQSVALPAGETFDLIFTSPPFFDFEIYTARAGQSVISHPRLSDWLVRFLCFSLRKSWAVLTTGGHMVIHMSDVYKTRVCEAMNLYCQGYLEGATYRGMLGSAGGNGRVRPMWVWRKSGATDRDTVRDAKEAMRRLYPSIWDLLAAGADRVLPLSKNEKKRPVAE